MPPPVLSEQDHAVLRSFANRIDATDPGAHNNLGVLYYQKWLIDEAIGAFTRALELDPKMLVAQRNLEIAYRHTGHYDRLVAELHERLRVAPDDREARWELGRTYASLGQHDAAASEFEALIARDPEDVAALTQLGLAEKSRGNLSEATEWFSRASELEPDSSVLHFYLGEVLYNRGLNADALASLTRATALNPDNADALYITAFVLGDVGRHEEARAAAKRAVTLNPTFARAQTNLSLERYAGGRRSAGLAANPQLQVAEGEALAHFNLGLAFRQRGYYNESLREYRLALDHGEDRLLVLQAMAEVHLLKRDHVAALELYERLVQDDANSPKLWNERGVVLHQLGNPDEAIGSYCKALEISPTYGLALNNLAVALAHRGQNDEALDTFRDGLRVAPELPTPRLNLGLLLLRLRRYQLALQAYRQVVETASVSAPAWNGIGLVLLELGRSADARNAFARAVESDPESAEAHYNLSFALSTLGEYDAALREVTRAQTLDPYYVPQKFRLAIDLQYEDPTIAVVPDISADVATDVVGQSIAFDQGIVDQLFEELDRPSARHEAPRLEDPYALARDYIAKGLLELAAAENSRALSRGGDQVEAHLIAGEIFTRRGLHGEALERYRAARAIDAGRRGARLGEVRALVALGRGSEAIVEAQVLAEEEPDDVDAAVTLARARLAASDPAGALNALAAARSRAPQRADLLKLEGDILVGLGDLERAREAYESALHLDPRLIQVWVDLGALHETRSDDDAAERSYVTALDTLPQYCEAVHALGKLYRRTGRPRAAVNLLADALASDPSDLDALLILGHGLLDDGRLKQALAAFERVLAFDKEDVAALFFAAVVKARLGQYRDAVAGWERVVTLDPGSPLAQEARRHARTAFDLQNIFRTEAA